MRYMTVTEASDLWGISSRRVRLLCSEGKIDGAYRSGNCWMIPDNLKKPVDGRELRKFKAKNLRIGSVDIDTLNDLRSKYPLSDGVRDGEEFLLMMAQTVSELLRNSGRNILSGTVRNIISGGIVPSVSQETHLLIVNFRSCVRSFFSPLDEPSETMTLNLYSKLMWGIEDAPGYRSGDVSYGNINTSVKEAMESVFKQYFVGWKNFHPVVSSSILYSNIMRIAPFGNMNPLIAYLVMASVLMGNGFLPPFMERGAMGEEAAALVVANGNNYSSVVSLIENRVKNSYRVLIGG